MPAIDDFRITQHVVDRLVDRGRLADPAVHLRRLRPASGRDVLVAVARTPGDEIHVLLADAKGHGMLAALAALFLLPPFYRMTDKGFGLDAIAGELLAKADQFLPAGIEVPLVVAAVSHREGTVKLWNAGNPEPVMLDADGRIRRTFRQRQPAVTASAAGRTPAAAEAHGIDGTDQLLLWSGDSFGIRPTREAILQAIIGAERSGRLARIDGILSGRGGDETGSVGALLMVDLAIPATVRAATGPAAPGQAPPAACSGWRCALTLGPAELKKADVVPIINQTVAAFGCSGVAGHALFITLTELFNNALDHGLLGLDSSLKQGERGMEAWLDERGRRLGRLESGSIDLEVEQWQENGHVWARIGCRDSGEGFRAGAAAAGDDQPYGRGLQLVRALGARVEHNARGNAVSVLIDLGPVAV